jgi:hypothetical protein
MIPDRASVIAVHAAGQYFRFGTDPETSLEAAHDENCGAAIGVFSRTIGIPVGIELPSLRHQAVLQQHIRLCDLRLTCPLSST